MRRTGAFRRNQIWWYDFSFRNQRIRESTHSRSRTVAKEAELQRTIKRIKTRDSRGWIVIYGNGTSVIFTRFNADREESGSTASRLSTIPLLGTRDDIRSQDLKTVGDFRIDELAKLELDPKSSTTSISDFDYISGPWIWEYAVPDPVVAYRTERRNVPRVGARLHVPRRSRDCVWPKLTTHNTDLVSLIGNAVCPKKIDGPVFSRPLSGLSHGVVCGAFNRSQDVFESGET